MSLRGSDRCARCDEPFTPLLTEAQIAGVLKSAIDAHGPVTVSNRHPAAKRIYAELKVLRRAEHDPRCVATAFLTADAGHVTDNTGTHRHESENK